MYITGSSWNRRKGTPLPEKVQNQQISLPKKIHPQGRQPKFEERGGNVIFGSYRLDLY